MAQHEKLLANASTRADRREAHNDTTSLLLRLPGEIRNSIYHYIFGNMVMQTHDTCASSGRISSYLTAHEDHDKSKSVGLRRLRGLLFTRHKVYTETRFLPFQLSIMCIGLYSISALSRCLKGPQRDAIYTFRVAYSTLARNSLLYASMSVGLKSLASFAGIKRVIVTYSSQWSVPSEKKGALVAGMRKDANKAELEVLFEVQK
ncbi:hypothetical protein CC86DRAFT_366783 [Ophiobolus disseminans]|uniref:Uncharacterized protein n=1 Tax=Ophiobolus disseminans TaxID=1469910 RepID=A0A6A7AFB6_9PLEO|nr:hypothetical protein CC86DRAFT_366783 [Ophiobolus disseminans]